MFVLKHFHSHALARSTWKQQGLCISRATAPVINVSIILIILPVCKTFNKLIHSVLHKLSIRLQSLYSEKLKAIHQCLAVTLVFTSGAYDVDAAAEISDRFDFFSAIHTVAHLANAINFLQNFDPELEDINWARDEDDVRSTNFPSSKRLQLIIFSRMFFV